jgi:nitrile hydratase subunit beta
MDGVHDMGGMHGFGKVEPEQDEPVFHDDWEARTFALCGAMLYTGAWCVDQRRFAREQLPPDVYLSSSYYKKWALGLEKQLAELGLAGRDELAAGHALRPGKPLKRKLSAAEVPHIISRGSFARPPQKPARFKPGDRVRTKNIHPNTHTRLPRYARDASGQSRPCAAVTSSPTLWRSARAKIRNGSTLCCSKGANCGARVWSLRSKSRSKRLNLTWSRHECGFGNAALVSGE